MISISTKELLYVIEHTPADQNIMLVGKHGIGKSEILTKFYTGSGKKVVPLFLGQMSDPGDIIGLPNKDEETGHTTFMPPYWFPTDGQPIVLFLDELNRARPEILQVVQDLVLNKTLAGAVSRRALLLSRLSMPVRSIPLLILTPHFCLVSMCTASRLLLRSGLAGQHATMSIVA